MECDKFHEYVCMSVNEQFEEVLTFAGLVISNPIKPGKCQHVTLFYGIHMRSPRGQTQKSNGIRFYLDACNERSHVHGNGTMSLHWLDFCHAA